MNDYSPLFWNDSAIFTTTNLSYVPDSDFVSSSANLVLKPLKYFVRPFEQFLFMIFFFSSQALVFECHVHFQTSWVLVQCDKHSEQPVISKILESLFVCVWMGRELSRCDFAAFPKLKLEPEGCPFETRRNLSRISYSIELPSEKGHLQWFWGMEGGAEIALHIPMGTISKRVGG